MHYKTINTYTLFKLVLFKAPGENMKIEKEKMASTGCAKPSKERRTH